MPPKKSAAKKDTAVATTDAAPKKESAVAVADKDTLTLSRSDLKALLADAVANGRAMGAAPAGPTRDPMLSTRKYQTIYNEAGEVICEPPYMDAEGRFLGGGGPTAINGLHPDEYFGVKVDSKGVATATQNHK